MGKAAIETEGLTKRYGATVALAELDLAVERGEIFGFLGPNGAGKTTAIRLLLALARPTVGQARILGLDVWRDAVRVHQHVAYVASEPALWPQLTGGQTLDLLARLHGACDLEYRDELIERFDLDVTKKVRAYSTGNRQKVCLVAAFMTRPEVLILDEPTAGLDPLKVQVFRECIEEASQRGQTVFVSSHVLSEIEAICDRIGLLRDGRLIDSGKLSEMRHLSARRVEARFEGPVPDLENLEGVTGVEAGDGRLRCLATGSMRELIGVLADARAEEVTSTYPSLEELFLTYYGEQPPEIQQGGRL